jgi:hypothetical protein
MLNSKKKVFFGKYPPGTAPYPPGRAVFGYLQQLSYLILCHTSYFKLHSVNSVIYNAKHCFTLLYTRSVENSLMSLAIGITD